MKNVKWVMEIELSNQDYQGYWQTRGWSDLATIQTLSIIDTATATPLDDGRYGIAGIAFAGIRGIDKVEVSVDNGNSWQEAEIKPAINGLTWNLWSFAWNPAPGQYDVLVRATDGEGRQQTDAIARPLPDGATGYHRLAVTVEA
jgi:DMSO/TMAO reductase YedYZ molybdopterin-dependent catalytic subunit